MERRRFLVGLGYGMSGLLLAANARPRVAEAGTGATGASLATGPASGAIRQAGGQEVRLPSAEPPTLDPGLAEDIASIDVISQLFDPLLAYDESGTSTGVGAQSWTVSSDGLTYTFTLRDGPTWSDGVPVRAQDYAWAWKRNVSPATASPYAKALFPIKNAAAINDGQLDPESLGVEARDDRTLVVTLEAPASYFPRLAATWTLAPLRQDVVEGYGDLWTEPGTIVTNGPFLLTEWTHDSRIVLTRNEQYWGTKPTIQRAVFRQFPEDGSEQVLAAYEAGEIDTTGAGVPSELPAAQMGRIMASPTLGAEMRALKQSGTFMLIVNHRRPHLQDARVRQALSLALDRRALLDTVMQRAGEPAASLQPEGIAGRTPSAWAVGDAATAAQLMEAAGYPNGRGFPTISLAYSTSAGWRLFSEYAQQRWRDVLGIDVRVESMEAAVFLRWRRGPEWERSGDLYRASWFSDYEDPNNWYNVVWDSANDADTFNGGWRNDQFDALVRQGTSEQDSARRASLYAQAEEIMAQDYPHIPLFHEEVSSLVKPYLQGYTPSRVLGLAPLRTMRVSR